MSGPRSLMVLALVWLALGASTVVAGPHVIVISIDGLPNYLLDDPQASLPVLRGLMARGVVARGGMGVSNPSVTWPNHTTLMTGVHPEAHGVIYNGLPERQGPGVPVKTDRAKSQRDLVHVPMLFDLLKLAGKDSAAINWPCTAGSESLGDNMPDVSNELQHTTPRLKTELEKAGLLRSFDGGSGIVRDEVWTEAACRIIRDRMPSLLALHILNLDSVHHRYGPKTPAGYTAAAMADAFVGRILGAIDTAGLGDSTTVIVVSDHGFIFAPKSIRPNVVLRKAGLLEADAQGQVTAARAHVVPEGGIGLVYLTNPATAEADRAAVRRHLDGVEGVAAILGPDDFPRYRLPVPSVMHHMADMIVACKEGYSIGGSAAGDEPVVVPILERLTTDS